MLDELTLLGRAQLGYVAVALATNLYGMILLKRRGHAYGPTKPWVGLTFIGSAGAVLALQDILGPSTYILCSLPILYIMTRYGIETHIRRLRAGGLAAYDPRAMGVIGVSTNVVGVALWSLSVIVAR
jgi:hypothetical protein